MIHQDPQYLCEVCKAELSYEWVHCHFDMLDYHILCIEHRDEYLKVKNSVVVLWDGTKFVAHLSGEKQ